MYIELSHRLSLDAPQAPGVPQMQLQHHHSIARGDASNLFVAQVSNHSGTHIDAPWHFIQTALRVCNFRGAKYVADRFPRLRALGLDTISLVSVQHLEEGLEAHRILFRGADRRFLIIEDMNLAFDLSHLRRVIALPLFIEGVDSSLCTVMGVTHQEAG